VPEVVKDDRVVLLAQVAQAGVVERVVEAGADRVVVAMAANLVASDQAIIALEALSRHAQFTGPDDLVL